MDTDFIDSFRTLYNQLFIEVFERTESVYETQLRLNSVLHDGFTNSNSRNSHEWTQQEQELCTKLLSEHEFKNTVQPKPNCVTIGNIGILVEPIITSAGTHDKNNDGAFFTPPFHTDFMCKESLCQYVLNHSSCSEQEIRHNVYERDTFTSTFDAVFHDSLSTLHIIDPSCGAGDFLIGMIRVLNDLEKKTITECDFTHVLHGADANHASVLLSRLRVELATHANSQTCGTFTTGDSLIQEVKNTHVPANTSHGLPTQLYQHKQNSTDSVKQLIHRALTKEKQTISHTQQTLTGTVTQTTSNQTESRTDFTSKKQEWIDDSIPTTGFYWPVTFSDVMQRGGFDIVVGNPPYVSKDDINDPIGKYDNLTYRKRLQNYVDETFKIQPARNSDLYVYFFFRALDILKQNGVVSYVTSNSWLDSRYGDDLRHGLLQESSVNLVLSTDERIFEGAEINAVTTVLSKRNTKHNTHYTRFVHTNNSHVTDEYLSALRASMRQIQYLGEDVRVRSTNTSRCVDVTTELLWKQGTDTTKTETTYSNGKWSLFLKAPDVFYDVITNDSITPLSEFATVILGTKSGANGFFYLPNNHYDVVGVSESHVTITHKQTDNTLQIPREFVEPIFCSFGTSQNPVYDMTDENMKWVLNIPRDVSDECVTEYIEWGSNHDITSCELCPQKRQLPFNESPSWAKNSSIPWYVITPHLKRARLLVRETIDTRFGAALTETPVVIDGTVYGITPLEDTKWSETEYKALTAILNSSIGMLLLELYGRTNYGGGALQVRVFEYENVPMININMLSDDVKQELASVVTRVNREDMSVYEMLKEQGTVSGVQEELDLIVMDEILELAESQKTSVYQSLTNLISKRVS